jgi:chloramphenicol-sensitive protein RarD
MNLEARRGVIYGFSAYLLWGAFPLYFRLLDRSGAVEILAHRVFWSLIVCTMLVSVLRRWRQVGEALRSPRRAALLAAAAVIIAVNWGVYIFAVNSGQVVEASLGYFVNPLLTVLLGVLVLRERLRRLQWFAVGIGVVAVTVLTVDYGRLPYIALILAASFGTYGLLKKKVGVTVGALAGLTSETMLLGPLALAALLTLEVGGSGHFTDHAPWQGLLLISAGAVTVLPLLLFSASARRVPLSTLGLLQYLTPVLQLLIGVTLLGEHMPASRWIGFALVWSALAVLTADSLRTARRRRTRDRPRPKDGPRTEPRTEPRPRNPDQDENPDPVPEPA